MYRLSSLTSSLLTCFATLIITLFLTDPQVVFEPTSLLPVLNTLFLSIIPFFIAFTSARLFLSVGHLPFLMLGCGMFALGTGGFASGWFIRQANGPNITVTIYNSGALLSALVLFAGVIVLLCGSKKSPLQRRGRLSIGAYLAVAAVSAGVVSAAVTGLTPPFILQGVGPTPVGRAVLMTAIGLYAATAIISFRNYADSRVELLRWYGTGLALLATGLVGVLLQKSVGSPIGWAGRTAQYAGCLCILAGVLGLWKVKIRTGRSIAAAFDEVSQKRITELEQINNELQRVIAEQQSTQKALQAKRMLLANIINGTSDAVYVKDLLGRYTLFNAAAEGLVGKSAAEVLGNDDNFLFRAEEAASVMADDRKVIESGTVQTFQEVVTDASACVRTFLSTKGPLLGDNGKAVGIFGIARDITDLKKAHDDLNRVMQEQRIVLENAPVAIFKMIDRKPVWINRKAEELFQYPKEVLEQQTTRIVYPSDGAFEEIGKEACRVLTEGLPFETEQDLVRRDGAHLRVRCIGKAIAPPDMSKGTLWLLEDITERRRMEDALRESETKFRSLIMNAPFLVTNVDRNGTIEFINKCSEGFDPSSVIGTSSYDYLEGESKETYRAALERTFKERTPQSIIVSGLGDNGALRWFESVLGPLVSGGKMDSAIQVTIDITERKLAEMHLENVREELEREVAGRTESLTLANMQLRAEIEDRMRAEARLLEHQQKMEALTQELSLSEERERERIAGELHDQVGQHLILVKMKLQWLANELASEKDVAMVEDLDKLLSQSIQDVRSLTFQLRPPILANAGLGPAIKWLAEELRENYGLNFEFVADDAPIPLRYEVRASIFQAVREILLNVVKHSRCTLVRIKLTRSGAREVIEVVDDGIGFDPDEISARKSRTGGFGLFNLRKKIEYLGGQLDIATEVGAGTRVTITVPLDAPAEGADQQC